jgi:N-acetylglutamate synthase/N-acetylornithine aminotransferase
LVIAVTAVGTVVPKLATMIAFLPVSGLANTPLAVMKMVSTAINNTFRHCLVIIISPQKIKTVRHKKIPDHK